jgi:hypothetical protein
MNASDLDYAPADLRDRFLNALDAQDQALCNRLATDLTSCINPLPGMACEQLGLPIGSTYGSAARRILGLPETQPNPDARALTG